jgi:hypothetical protein
MELHVSINKLGEFLRMDMLNIVPFPVYARVFEPEVSGEVHHLFRQTAQITELLHGLRMGQGHEKKIHLFEVIDGTEIQGSPFPKIGVNPCYRLSRISFGCGLVDLYVGMIQEEPEKLATAVTGCANDANLHLLPTSRT